MFATLLTPPNHNSLIFNQYCGKTEDSIKVYWPVKWKSQCIFTIFTRFLFLVSSPGTKSITKAASKGATQLNNIIIYVHTKTTTLQNWKTNSWIHLVFDNKSSRMIKLHWSKNYCLLRLNVQKLMLGVANYCCIQLAIRKCTVWLQLEWKG